VKNTKRIIGLIVALVLIAVFCHPGWLPLPGEIRETMGELLKGHFLLKGDGRLTLAHILMVIPACLIVWAVCTVLSLLLELIGRKNGRSATVTNLLESIVRYLGFIVALFWSLSILGVDTTAVLASVGIIGLIIGFGAQSLIEDIITGFFIIFEGEYGVGDVIILDDFRGTVRSIGVRTTVIEDAGGNLKIVNNSDIRNLQNRSKNSSLAVCDIGVSYETDIEKLRDVLGAGLATIREKHPDLFLSDPLYKGIERFEDSSIVLRFTVETKEDDIFVAKRCLNEEIYSLLKANKISIPFPQVVVHPSR